MMQRFVLMGVSGCGKSSVGQALSECIDIRFFDGDALHPEANIQKMSSGIALNDADRAPWLAEVGRTLGRTDGPVVVGCSSLKRRYRDIIRKTADGDVGFLHLYAPKDVLARRVAERTDHFMPPSLLDSQFADLEHLQDEEAGTLIDISKPLESVVLQARNFIQEAM